ncbi:MAG: hypothetical protein KAS65_09325 [Candidatus Aminicenantes bacterium]|nr:hypothetical protein [Candidatus Aminicenantes bacterium]
MLKKKSISITVMILMFAVFIIESKNNAPAFKDLKLTLPHSADLGNWKPVNKPQIFKGDDLFLYINGGAEIYHEYGFKQVLTLEYQNDSNHSINLEIFEMKDSYSAFGIYSFKTGKNGKKISAGEECLLEDYYLNFWKGDFQVTLTGLDSSKETINGLVVIAMALDKKITLKGKPPFLRNLLPVKDGRSPHITYIKGNIALFNYYPFGTKNIFGFKEGIIGDYDHLSILLFRYKTKKESRKWLQYSRKELLKNTRFSNYNVLIDGFSLIDNEKRNIMVTNFRNYILIIMGTNKNNTVLFLEKMCNHLRQKNNYLND